MKNKVRFYIILIADLAVVLCLILLLTVGLGGMKYAYYSEEIHGDFVVRFYNDRSECDIVGLSETGRTQTTLILPRDIDGAVVDRLGARSLIEFAESKYTVPRAYSTDAPDFENNVIQKIVNNTGENTYFVGDLPAICPELKKIFYLISDLPYYAIETSDGVTSYVSSAYNEKVNSTSFSIANISYLLNYESDGDGYYFIDDCDYGGKIDYVPQPPIREGYTFGGWYKESECINRWDFATDTLPAKLTETNENGENEVKYQETKLYAKWI